MGFKWYTHTYIYIYIHIYIHTYIYIYADLFSIYIYFLFSYANESTKSFIPPHQSFFFGVPQLQIQDSSKWCQVSDAWCARWIAGLGGGKNAWEGDTFLKKIPLKLENASWAPFSKCFQTWGGPFFFFLGGGFSTTRMEEGAKILQRVDFKTWWTWQIYSCMTDLEGDVLIHIGYINLYEWFCYICMRVKNPQNHDQTVLGSNSGTEFWDT